MKQFFKYVLATFVGLVLTSIVMVFILIGIIAAANLKNSINIAEINSNK